MKKKSRRFIFFWINSASFSIMLSILSGCSPTPLEGEGKNLGPTSTSTSTPTPTPTPTPAPTPAPIQTPTPLFGAWVSQELDTFLILKESGLAYFSSNSDEICRFHYSIIQSEIFESGFRGILDIYQAEKALITSTGSLDFKASISCQDGLGNKSFNLASGKLCIGNPGFLNCNTDPENIVFTVQAERDPTRAFAKRWTAKDDPSVVLDISSLTHDSYITPISYYEGCRALALIGAVSENGSNLGLLVVREVIQSGSTPLETCKAAHGTFHLTMESPGQMFLSGIQGQAFSSFPDLIEFVSGTNR